MEFLSSYFGHHKDKKIVFFVGNKNDISDLSNLLNTVKFEKCFVLFENPNLFEKTANFFLDKEDFLCSRVEYINKNELLRTKTNEYAFVFDNYTNVSEMIELSKLSPKKFVGFFEKEFDTFSLWEAIKQHCGSIVLARDVDSYRNEVLEWNKDDGFDYELCVIFPVYKVENYLIKCLDSVTEWKAPYIEFVFVDDGSPDDSYKIIQEYAKKDPRVKLLRKENGGCASARQYGIDHTNSRYIGLIDPDDFIDPTMFHKLLSKAMMGGYDIAYSGYNEYYEETQTSQAIEDLIGEPYTFGLSDEKAIDNLIAYRRVAIWRGIYRRKFLDINGIRFHTELKRFDDLPFKVETFARAKSVVSINEYLYYYRMGRPGQDVSANDERLYIHFEIFKILDEFFKKYRSSLQLRHYYQVKVQTHFWGLNLLKPELRADYMEKAAKDLKIQNNKKNWRRIIKTYYKSKEARLFIKKMYKKV